MVLFIYLYNNPSASYQVVTMLLLASHLRDKGMNLENQLSSGYGMAIILSRVQLMFLALSVSICYSASPCTS
jgi:hypothetical protein